MPWRTALCDQQAVHPRILSLSVRLLLASEQCNVVVAQNVDVANANKLIIADVVATIVKTATPAATAARGHEIEFLVRQFDRVSKCGHLLHVESPLDVKWRDNDLSAATSLLAARPRPGCTVVK